MSFSETTNKIDQSYEWAAFWIKLHIPFATLEL